MDVGPEECRGNKWDAMVSEDRETVEPNRVIHRVLLILGFTRDHVRQHFVRSSVDMFRASLDRLEVLA